MAIEKCGASYFVKTSKEHYYEIITLLKIMKFIKFPLYKKKK